MESNAIHPVESYKIMIFLIVRRELRLIKYNVKVFLNIQEVTCAMTVEVTHMYFICFFTAPDNISMSLSASWSIQSVWSKYLAILP